MKQRVEAEMTVSALSGEKGNVEALLATGLRSFAGVRRHCCTMTEAILAASNKRRTYVTTRLPYGAKLILPLGYPSASNNKIPPVATIVLRSGATDETQAIAIAARKLSARVEGNPAAAVRVLMAIERARRAVLALAEEGTRWT